MNTVQHFNSLADCLSFIVREYPQETISISAKDIETGEVSKANAPRYLYRGEPAAYDTTESSMQRLKINVSLSPSEREELETLAQWVDAEMQDKAALSPMYSAGYCQHYGLPSELLDFTADIEVAGTFASLGEVRPVGLLAVLDVATVAPQSIIVDLTQHPFGSRPRRQMAYGFFHRRFIDIKAEECVSALGIRWYSFSRSSKDIVQFTHRLEGAEALLDAHRDQIAGYMQLCIDDYVRSKGKLQDASARWLSGRIAPVPLATKIIDRYPNGNPRTVEAIPAEDAGLRYDQDAEQAANRRRWSADFPDAAASGFSAG